MQQQVEFVSDQHAIFAEVAQQRDWQQKYRLLMQLGKALPPLSDALKRDELLVAGCESAAWLCHQQLDGRHYWGFDSEARIIKGVITALLSQLNGLPTEELKAIDLHALYQQLGLAQGLSPSRSNGVAAVIRRIQQAL
ncbi:MAG: SufE family protein [Rheinheimera sp.]|nr:SufE family protein [Rheinheimera sp.]